MERVLDMASMMFTVVGWWPNGSQVLHRWVNWLQLLACTIHVCAETTTALHQLK